MLKKLNLLGLLRGQELHGYGLVEYLNNHSGARDAAIGKSNAYRLLHAMEADGLIRSETQRDGKRPQRQVFRVTPAGEKYFREGVLRELGEGMTSNAPGLSVLNYVDEVDRDLARAQLEQRKARILERRARLSEIPSEALCLHPALELELRHVEVELEWIAETLARLAHRSSESKLTAA